MISDLTKKKRQQIKNLMDDFMSFQWDGVDAFEQYGAFILNDKKGSLKFYNGPSFSNEYSKPQFENNTGELMGVTFNRQTISFSIGIYWISIEDYRKLIYWLHPLKISSLIFGFEPKFQYNVKLSKIGDSTRWIVGKEDGEPRYYTELNLTFEVQGAQCAKGINSYEFESWNGSNGEWSTGIKVWIEDSETKEKKLNPDFIPSDLSTPLEIPLTFNLKDRENNKDINYHIELKAVDVVETEENELLLFSVDLCNLAHNQDLSLNINYHSEAGLIYLKYGNSPERLLSLLNTSDTGEKIIRDYKVNKFFLPGLFDYPTFNYEKFKLKLIIKKFSKKETKTLADDFFNKTQNNIICYPRTNLI